MNKEGYQPIKTKKTTKIIPPNTGSNVQMKKDGYTWEDLDRSYWEGFDNAKNKMEKRIEDLEHQLTHRNCLDCSNHSSNLRMRNLDLEKENAELKERVKQQSDRITELTQELDDYINRFE